MRKNGVLLVMMLCLCWVPFAGAQSSTVQNISGPFRLFFYSFDCNEPIHVHVRREKMTCKFWLEPIALNENHGFSSRELNQIRRIIQANTEKIIEAWYEHCG